MRRRPSTWLGMATSCNRPPADVRAARDTLAYALGRADGRREADEWWHQQARRAIEVVELEELYGDGDGGLK